MHSFTIAVLPGDGIGPEIMQEALKLLSVIEEHSDLSFQCVEKDVGGIAIDRHGMALPEDTLNTCLESDAVLFGSIGGPKWESLPPQEQPERAALLALRKQLSLFANLRPSRIYPSCAAISPLRADIAKRGLDVMIVRELNSGIYFGQPKHRSSDEAFDTMRYRREEIERIATLAFSLAANRNKKVTSIDKANVLESMVLWRDVVSEVSTQFPEISCNHMYVDNAAMQLIVNPQQFDVVLCGNLFGDILSDEAAVLGGSLGMLPSASIAMETTQRKYPNLYEPAGGSAPDIAGQGIANPIAQILSLALLIRITCKRPIIADALEQAVATTLQDGVSTRDITQDGSPVSTAEMGDAIAERFKPLLA